MLIEFHLFDNGAAIRFDRKSVALVEDSASGAGTTVWLSIGDRTRELHLVENYDEVCQELEMSVMERAMRDFQKEAQEAADAVPFR